MSSRDRIVTQLGMGLARLGIVRTIRIAGLGLVALLLAACSGQTETAGTAQPLGAAGEAGTATVPGVPAATVAFVPEGGDQLSPKDPIVVKASGGTLQAVTVTNPQTGNGVKGDL